MEEDRKQAEALFVFLLGKEVMGESIVVCEPGGFNAWNGEEWGRFSDAFKRREESRSWTGAFGGIEVAVLIALATGKIAVGDLARVYRHSAIDMLERWKADLENGVTDEELEGFGINDLDWAAQMLRALGKCFDKQD